MRNRHIPRRIVQIDLSVGRRTVFEQHVEELAARVRRLSGNKPGSPSLTLADMLDALAERDGHELTVKLDADQEAALLAAIDDWMLDAHKLPDDILALRQALRRLGV